MPVIYRRGDCLGVAVFCWPSRGSRLGVLSCQRRSGMSVPMVLVCRRGVGSDVAALCWYWRVIVSGGAEEDCDARDKSDGE